MRRCESSFQPPARPVNSGKILDATLQCKVKPFCEPRLELKGPHKNTRETNPYRAFERLITCLARLDGSRLPSRSKIGSCSNITGEGRILAGLAGHARLRLRRAS